MQTTNTTKSIVAFFLMLVMLVSSFLPYVPTKTALAGGVTMGSAGSVSAVGAQKGLAGGVTYVDDMVFRVGLNRSELYYHDGTSAEKSQVYEKTKHLIPNVINALYFVPSGRATSNFQIGVYNGSTRTLDAISSADSKNVVFNLHGQGSQPPNKVKDILKKSYNRDGSGGKKAYKDLLGYKWKNELLSGITKEDAVNIWSYILAPTSKSSSGNSYSIEKRINAMVSQYAEQLGTRTMTDAELEDIYTGYLGLLVATYKLVPEKMMGIEGNGARIPYGDYWARGPEAYLKIAELNLARQPITLAIDTAMEIKWNGSSTRMYISAFDYLYYYTAVSNASLPRGGNKDTYVAQGNGDYYKLFTAVVKKDIASGKVKRISDAYNPGNVFSFAASAIDYPGYQFFTSGGNAKYLRGGGQTAFIDSLTFYKAQSSVARGYIMSTFMVKLKADATLPDNEATLKPYLIVNPKEKLVKSGQEVIGESNTLDIKHKPNDAIESQWKELFAWSDKETSKPNQKIKVKVQVESRQVTPSSSGQPVYSSPLGNITTSYVDFTRSELLDFINGKKVITVYDNVAAEPIEAGTTKKFTYNVKLSYQYTNGSGLKTGTSEQMTDWASYIRPKDPPKYMGYTSDYETYGEIKHDRPNSEKWEAMAGVPSNKSLYFSVGGSEFVVDVELEYIEDETSVWRTYRSYFSGTPSEYKDGDNAGTGSIGGHSVDLHNGGTYTKTWTGSIPNRGQSQTVSGSGDVSATAAAVPDRTEYNNAMKEAQAYIKEVNQTVITHTAASDKITRSHKNWGAHVSTDAPNDPKDITETNSCWHTETVGSGEDQTTIDVPDPCTVTATKDADGTFTIVVSFTVPPHIVDGPECTYDLPLVEDNWRQKISYDYVKIIRAEVYQLVEGKLKKVDHVLDSEEDITATIQSGKTSMWHNIAQQNSGGDDKSAQSSKHGRIRYSLEELQHDTVVWNEGTRTNKSAGMGANGASTSPDTAGKLAVQGGGHNNAWSKQGILYNRPASQISDTVDAHKNIVGQKTSISNSVDSLDMATPEWKKFDERRRMKNIATIVSDFIILQTSSGDMSVMYFQKDSKEITSQEQFPDVKATREEMWENNPLSSANWDVKEIPMGSYNGWFKEVGTSASSNKKFWGYDRFRKNFINNISGGSTGNYRHKEVKTRLDQTGGGVFGANKRTTRPSTQLQIYINKNIIPTTPNDDYEFGESHSFFERILTYKSANPYKDYPGVALRKNQYTPKNEPDFSNKMGLKEEVGYSRNHELINKIVIHTPVSVQDATIIGLPSYLDQRTATPAGGAAELIDRDNANRVAYENSLGTPNIFTDAIKQWTSIKTTIDTTTKTDITIMEGGGKDTKIFTYNGGVQSFVAPANGTYTLEVYGAEGGTSGYGGRGGYSKGDISLTKGQTLYIYAGGQTGFNGGGSGHGRASDSGGGATDIRLGGTSLSNRIIVAGGGGGYGGGTTSGGAGGGLTGSAGSNRYGTAGTGGTQYSGGTGGTNNGNGGYLGQGGSNDTGGNSGGGGGGGGYFGGGAGGNDNPNYDDMDDSGGGGGSGYLGGVTGGTMLTGSNSGNGYARISYDLPLTLGSGSSSTTDKQKPSVNDQDYYYESGDPLGYKGYTWADLFGPNWTNYVKVTTSTKVNNYNSSSSTTDDKGTQGLAKGWTFDSNTEGFVSGTSALSYVSGGYLKTISASSDGYFYSPNGLNIGGLNKSKDFIEIRLKNNSSGKVGEIFFTTNSQGAFVETHKLTFNMTAKDSTYVTYRVPASQSLNWSGILTQLRFDLANGRDTGGEVLVDYIKVYTSSTANQSGVTETVSQKTETLTDTSTIETVTTEITSVDTDSVKRDLDLFPEYMPDGTPNPVRLGFGKPSTPDSIVNTPINTSTGGQINVGTFILLDREFQVYYPNRGDFAQQPTLHGIPEITTTRGLSYVNGMDVTEWTESKYISFEFAVIYEGTLYPKGAWIELPVPQEYFDFYAVLGNNEYVAADVKYQSYAINYIGDEPDDVTNKKRYDDYTARSTAYKLMYTDVVGRIGNFQVTDTEDFRFSNLFKQPKPDGKWIVEGIVKEVNPAKQNKFYADLVDIRNVDVSDTGVGLDTYGTQSWIRGSENRLNLPVNPSDNVHSSLKEEYLKTGYDLFSSIQTIGDYGRGAVRVLPYYYKLDLKTGQLIPIDAYQRVEDRLEPVNKFGSADGGFVPSDIYPYQLVINWIEEASRFNYTLDEAEITALASQTKGEYRYGEVVDVDGEVVQGIQDIDPLMTPSGSYINIGNAQRIVLDSTARTFIGNTETYGNDKNPGDVLDDSDYYFHGQKWYMKIGLPSSTVFVEKGKEPTKENIEALQEGTGVVLLAADIISLGEVYTLRYNQYTDKFTAFKDGVGGTFNVADLVNSARQKGVNLPPIIALYDLSTTATIDVDLQGSH